MKISIIVPILNPGVYGITRMIKSFLSQDYEDKELIIIDGGSTDGTIDVIKKYRSAAKAKKYNNHLLDLYMALDKTKCKASLYRSITYKMKLLAVHYRRDDVLQKIENESRSFEEKRFLVNNKHFSTEGGKIHHHPLTIFSVEKG